MNIQAIKLSLIEWLIQVKDEKIINEMQSIREKEFVGKYKKSLKPFSEAEFTERVMASEEDIKYGRTTSLEDFVKESENWQ